VGNLTEAKGYRELLAAISVLESGGWCWQIVGSDRLDARFAGEFERSAAEWIRNGQIRRLSISCPIELAGLMARADLFIAASHYESYGMALAEAVTAGLPVVTTDVGDAALITRFARSAWLVPVGDEAALQVALRSAVAAHRHGWRCSVAREDIPVRTWEQAFTEVRAICEREAGCHAAGHSDDFA
jgi:glycosyltransferase involved in cell wall biosynthesis